MLSGMRTRQKIGAATGFARVRALGRRVPVAARINVNHACHSRCNYCAFWDTPSEEMDTATLCRVIRELGALGTRRLSLSGGEPMLRDDMAEIVAAGVDAGISVSMNATGYRFVEQPEALRRLDLVKLSLDGREETHDRVRRRPGAYGELMEGVEVCRRLGVRYAFCFTLTRETLGDVAYAAELARSHGTFVAFQPVMAHQHADHRARDQYPSQTDMLEAVDWLIQRKRDGDDSIRNSLGGLDHMRRWPTFGGDLRCFAGRAFVMIEANGDVVPCDRIPFAGPLPSCVDRPLADVLDELPEVRCAGCAYVGTLEINRLLGLRWDAAPAILRVVSRNGG